MTDEMSKMNSKKKSSNRASRFKNPICGDAKSDQWTPEEVEKFLDILDVYQERWMIGARELTTKTKIQFIAFFEKMYEIAEADPTVPDADLIRSHFYQVKKGQVFARSVQ